MNATRMAAVAAVLGGLVWVAVAIIDWGENLNPVAYAVGLVWFLLALGALGYTLVEHAPVWLRAVVSVATPALGCVVWVTVGAAFRTEHLPVLWAGLARGHRAAR
jgi:hypothetical protein